jgi:ketosteroid isomerase-like protein
MEPSSAMTKTGLVALVVALPVLACSKASSDSATDSAAVMTAYEQYRHAWLRGDTAGALGLISDSIRIYISGLPDVVGKAAARTLFLDEMSGNDVQLLRLDHQDVVLSGDHVIVTGRFEEIELPKKGGPPVRGIGRYMTIWRREAGGWRIIRYMLNDLPPEKSRR